LQVQAEQLRDELIRMRKSMVAAREEATAKAQELERTITRLTKERDIFARQTEELTDETAELREGYVELQQRLGREAERREEEFAETLASLQQDLGEVRSRLVGVQAAPGEARGVVPPGKVTDLEGTVTLLLQDCEILHMECSKVSDALAQVVTAPAAKDVEDDASDGAEPIPDNLLCKMHGLAQDMNPLASEVFELRTISAKQQETSKALEDTKGEVVVLQGQIQRAEKTAREMDELRKKAKDSWHSATEQCKGLELKVADLEQAAQDRARQLQAEVKQLQGETSRLADKLSWAKSFQPEAERLQAELEEALARATAAEQQAKGHSDEMVQELQEEIDRLKDELEQALTHGESAEAEMLRTLAAMRRMDREFVCVS